MGADTSSPGTIHFLDLDLCLMGVYGMEGRYTSHHRPLKSQVLTDCKHSHVCHAPQSECRMHLSFWSSLGPFMVSSLSWRAQPSVSIWQTSWNMYMQARWTLQPISLGPQCYSVFRSLLRTQFPIALWDPGQSSLRLSFTWHPGPFLRKLMEWNRCWADQCPGLLCSEMALGAAT